jgi:hypothetical protein
MAMAYFKPLSEIREITVISVIAMGVHSLTKVKLPIPEKTKPPEGGLSPKKQSDVPNG